MRRAGLTTAAGHGSSLSRAFTIASGQWLGGFDYQDLTNDSPVKRAVREALHATGYAHGPPTGVRGHLPPSTLTDADHDYVAAMTDDAFQRVDDVEAERDVVDMIADAGDSLVHVFIDGGVFDDVPILRSVLGIGRKAALALRTSFSNGNAAERSQRLRNREPTMSEYRCSALLSDSATSASASSCSSPSTQQALT